MKKTALALAILAFGGLMSAGASAAPLSPASSVGVKHATFAEVEEVRYKKRGWHKQRNWNKNRNYRYYGERHPRYHGWYRYHARPYNWNTRGCVAIGPVWFCP